VVVLSVLEGGGRFFVTRTIKWPRGHFMVPFPIGHFVVPIKSHGVISIISKTKFKNRVKSVAEPVQPYLFLLCPSAKVLARNCTPPINGPKLRSSYY